MGIPDIPADLIAFLRAGSSPTLDIGCYGIVTLFRSEELRVETLTVTPTNAPFAADDPHREDCGHYPVPAVNLIRGDPRPGLDFPAWLFLWLPNERRYGSFNLDHRDVLLFAPGVQWADIAADPESFALASEGGNDAPVPIEFLRPWPQYPFVAEEYPSR
jgi:hypothetical protein